MEETVILGIDVAKEKYDVVLRRGQQTHYEQFANSPSGHEDLRRWLKKAKVQTGRACLEATSIYGDALALYLHEQGWIVHVVNPARLNAYAKSQMRRAKTDKSDAYLIAQFAALHELVIWQPPSPQQRRLRELVRHITDLKTTREAEANRRQTVSDVWVQASLEEIIAFVDRQIAALLVQMQAHIDQHPDLKEQQVLLDSIPGIASWTAARLIAEIQDIRYFANAKELVAYAGLNPTICESGSSVRGQTHISKMGNAHLRDTLYMPALSAKRHNPILREFAERLAAQGKLKQVVTVAVMRKLLHLVYGILKSKKPFDPKFIAQGA